MPPQTPISSPDGAPIRLLTVPDSAPPYDGETAADDHREVTASSGPALAGQQPEPGTLGQQRHQPAGPVPPGQQRHLPTGPGTPGSQPGRGAYAPGDAAAWPGRFAQVLAETLAGSRSQGQIVPWTNVQARRRIRQLGPMLTAGAAPRIRRVVTTRPAADVVEMTVIVGFGDRVRALAVRLERDRRRYQGLGQDATGSRWVCTAVEAA